MSRESRSLVAWNRGLISQLGLGRVDLERSAMSAEEMTNWMPRVLGSMMLRPGFEYTGSTAHNGFARYLPFIFAVDDYAHAEIADRLLRIWVDDELVTRLAVDATVTNGEFTTDLTGWTDADESGGASTWLTGGYMALLGDGTGAAIRRQQVACGDPGTRHALRIIVARGPVVFRVGSAAGGEQYISETTLGTGFHSLAFTPTADFHIQLSSALSYTVLVDSIAVEPAGVMSLPTPWTTADIPNVRVTQSGDVLYIADGAHQQRKIERRAADSWSVVLYAPETGPFRVQNVSNITITPSALSGDVNLTASKAIFRAGHVGALFRIASQGQTVTRTVSAENTFSDPIRIVGVGEQRRFSIIVAGTFTATVTLQYSLNAPGSWVDVTPYTTATSTTHLDGQDNQVIYYRIGVKTGDFTSGPVAVTLSHAAGSITGTARATGLTSTTVMTAVVLEEFGALTASSDWWEGQWSDYRGWPSANALFEGRKWLAGDDKMNASISDQHEDFDDEVEGDAGPISRSIGEGPVDSIHWLLPLGRLLVGTASNSANIPAVKIDGNNILAARSSSFDEPMTPTNFALKNTSARGVFVDRSGQRLFELGFNLEVNDYQPEDLSILTPDLNDAGIAGIAVQMKPDVRVHCWRTDGTVGLLIFDRTENVICWCEIETDGVVEDVSVLPGPAEDQVYYTVKRTINGSVKRYREKWALESQCTGFPEARLADAHTIYDGASATIITGLDHLEGETVVVWGWPFTDSAGRTIGRDLGEYTVIGGAITLSDAVTGACIGKSYRARWKSAKQAFAARLGAALNQKAKTIQLGVVLHNTHYQGLTYGQDFDHLDPLPLVVQEEELDEHTIHAQLDEDMFEINSTYDTDPRLCLQAEAPRPCTLIAATFALSRSEKP
jgi:hypothetical protein